MGNGSEFGSEKLENCTLLPLPQSPDSILVKWGHVIFFRPSQLSLNGVTRDALTVKSPSHIQNVNYGNHRTNEQQYKSQCHTWRLMAYITLCEAMWNTSRVYYLYRLRGGRGARDVVDAGRNATATELRMCDGYVHDEVWTFELISSSLRTIFASTRCRCEQQGWKLEAVEQKDILSKQ